MAGRPNPFLPMQVERQSEPELDVRDDVLGERLSVAGPEQPGFLSGETTAFGASWPVHSISPFDGITVMGLHGGAGVSTVAKLLGEQALDAGQGWPVAKQNSWTGTRPELNVLAVARDHHAGLQAATRFARAWATGSLTSSRLVGLVLVSASPRLTDARRREMKKILGMTPLGTHLPWMDAWIEGPVETDHLPLRIRRVMKAISQKALTKETK